MRRVVRIGVVAATVVAEVIVCAALVLGVHLAQGENPGAEAVAGQAVQLYVEFVVVMAVLYYSGRALHGIRT
jgi:hypothetical protein